MGSIVGERGRKSAPLKDSDQMTYGQAYNSTSEQYSGQECASGNTAWGLTLPVFGHEVDNG